MNYIVASPNYHHLVPKREREAFFAALLQKNTPESDSDSDDDNEDANDARRRHGQDDHEDSAKAVTIQLELGCSQPASGLTIANVYNLSLLLDECAGGAEAASLMFRKRDIGNLLERSLNSLYRCSEFKAGSSYDVAQAYLWRYTKAKAKAYGEAAQRREARERGVERVIGPRGDALVVAIVSRFSKRSQSAELGVVQQTPDE
ncbi:hypothetical protein GGX14DRAFT_394026 [Mycena pura]|uniref:Uncharacterized protein n=1 Tax=Mycena pura TaxID=153505 RepID=A0AAD6YI82_9AGAR|nr:hypothetical protein GGX14DRAFT_394026 [Mycena pura]